MLRVMLLIIIIIPLAVDLHNKLLFLYDKDSFQKKHKDERLRVDARCSNLKRQ